VKGRKHDREVHAIQDRSNAASIHKALNFKKMRISAGRESQGIEFGRSDMADKPLLESRAILMCTSAKRL
jgi:hypothetical protein